MATHHEDDQEDQKPSKADQMNSEVKQGGKKWPKPEEVAPVTPEQQPQAQPKEPTALGHESIAELEKQLNDAELKINDYWNEIMLAKAEAANIRARSERDVANARKFALEKFLKDLLPTADSLEHALMCEYGDNAFAKSIHEGVELTLNMLTQTMERYGIKVLDPLGQAFDPQFHEAIGMEPAGEQPANTVIRVMQKGYLLNERVVRPAMVVVTK